MTWIWQRPDWPEFRYNVDLLRDRDLEFRLLSERLAGRLEGTSLASQQETVIDLMLSEALKTSEIEGEHLDRASVRSSLLALVHAESVPDRVDRSSLGAASLLVDVRQNWQADLTDDLLCHWQSMVVRAQRLMPVLLGMYRVDPSPMQIVSGPYGRQRVHFEAPPAARVPDEMASFIRWYNASANKAALPGVARAAIAHLWFEVIHPFDDGNGRVGRAVADHALSQSLGYPTMACLATAIESDKKAYYRELERASRGSLDIQDWLDYFCECVFTAQAIAREEVGFVADKARFYETYGHCLNERQAKLVARVFAQGRHGFEGGITTRKYEIICKCPNRTASRDIADLVTKGILVPLPGGGRNARYELALLPSAQ